MDKIEAVRLALTELGDVSREQVAAFVQERHGLKIMPGIVSVIKAMFRERELLASFYQGQEKAAGAAKLSSEAHPATSRPPIGRLSG